MSQGYSTAAGWQTSSASPPRAGSQTEGRDRRTAERFDLNNAPGSLIHKGTRLRCSIVDISLTGCCVRTTSPFTAGARETVKVVFPIFEMVLSIWGATQWVRGEHLLGIQFRHPTAQSKNLLAGLLTCLIDNSAAEVVKKAMAEIIAEPGENPIIQFEHPPTPPSVSEPEPEPEPEPDPEPEPADVVLEPAAPQIDLLPLVQRPRLSGEEQVLSMEAGDSPATLTLLGDDSMFAGDVVDLSLTGCLMRLPGPCYVRLKAQAEVSFHVQGLPFRLGAVTQEMHDKRTVEIRFAQMSRRKRDDLNQVISEMIEASNLSEKTS